MRQSRIQNSESRIRHLESCISNLKFSLKILIALFFGLLLPVLANAQIPDPVSFTVSNAPEDVKIGEPFKITVQAQIEGNWHLYSVHNDPDAGPFPTRFSVSDDAMQIAGGIEESQPIIEHDPNFDVELGWHSEEAVFIIPLKFSKKPVNSSDFSLDVLYQVCNDRACLPPKTETIALPASVSERGVSSLDNAEQFTPSKTIGIGGSGIISFIWLAIIAGFAALLTPCVFPMIPFTVAYFSKQKEKQNNTVLGGALGFGAAIIIIFTALGALLALFIGASGAVQFASNPWINLFIGIALIFFALSLLGAYDLRLPHQFTNWLNKKSDETSGLMGVGFIALTISAVSFSCTAPFIGGVLAATAGGQWFYPIIGMIGFSAAFALPFVLFALFPSWLQSLPKSGSWMNIVTVLLGFLELAAAFKFLSNADLVWGLGLISRPLTIAAWIVIFLLAGLYLLGFYTINRENKPKTIGAGRRLLSVPLFLFSFYLIPGLSGASLGIWDAWLPPKQVNDANVVSSIAIRNDEAASEYTNWSVDYEASLAEAIEAEIPVFIDFTGYTCTNCRAMETNVFPLAAVQKRFEKMELVRLYTDGGSNATGNQKFQFELTNTVALPTYVIVDPVSGNILSQLIGYTQKEDFLNFLNHGLNKFDQLNKP